MQVRASICDSRGRSSRVVGASTNQHCQARRIEVSS